jgi:hypothetical protein
MTVDAIFVDPEFDDDTRREHLFDGQLFVYSSSPSVMALVDHARAMVEEGFGGLDPESAQDRMDVKDYAALLSDLKPKFIHHERSKELIQSYLADIGCDPERTYFDVPRLRTSTSGGYLTTGIAYAFHPHRDCWYSAPFAQQNFWMPVYGVTRENALAFHPRYWIEPVPNGSRKYNYAEWNRVSRFAAAEQIGTDTREQPKPEVEIDLDPQVRPIPPVGGMLVFSGAQLHSSIPNTSGKTRISIDFRVVNLDDLEADRGAPNIDSECTGTTLGDYLRVSDLAPLPAELIARYDTPMVAAER